MNETRKYKKVVLVVLDGFGVASASPGNAIVKASAPAFDSLVNNYPSVTLQAAGPNVGLAWGEPGNSEVGHTCLGAGRVVLQDAPRIDASISSGKFFENKGLVGAIEHVKAHNSSLHLIGLVGSGGVHASQLHLYALLTKAASEGLKKVYVHVITDGRDAPPDDGYTQVRALESKLVELGIGKIASVCGRFYAMDRAKHWDLTEKAYKAWTEGLGERASGALGAIKDNYESSIYDETIPPTVLEEGGQLVGTVSDNDSVIFFNYRQDRGIQMARAFAALQTTPLKEKCKMLAGTFVATMTDYETSLPAHVLFPKLVIKNTLSQVIDDAGKKQYHIAESEKYAHVTYFFDNGRQEPSKNEVWEIVKSSSSYQERYQNVPEMEAAELTERFLKKFNEDYDFYLINFANPDMVGHTGNFLASVKAVECVDACLQRIADEVLKKGDAILFVTADHGNVEELQEEGTGRATTSHTTNPVPLVVVSNDLKLKKARKHGYLYLATQIPEGLLSDVAPTMLDSLGLAKPKEMTGFSLMTKIFEEASGGSVVTDEVKFEVSG